MKTALMAVVLTVLFLATCGGLDYALGIFAGIIYHGFKAMTR